jgi:hypothetical protein
MDAATAKKPIICPAGYYRPEKTSDYSQNMSSLDLLSLRIFGSIRLPRREIL